jgi:hypothetical protein
MVAYVHRMNAAEGRQMNEQGSETIRTIKTMCAQILIEKDTAAFAQLLIELNGLLETMLGPETLVGQIGKPTPPPTHTNINQRGRG